MHDRRVSVPRARALPLHDEVEFPRARVEIEDEQVVSVNRPVVTSEDVERVAMHRS